jgi:hypothetical protein
MGEVVRGRSDRMWGMRKKGGVKDDAEGFGVGRGEW